MITLSLKIPRYDYHVKVWITIYTSAENSAAITHTLWIGAERGMQLMPELATMPPFKGRSQHLVALRVEMKLLLISASQIDYVKSDLIKAKAVSVHLSVGSSWRPTKSVLSPLNKLSKEVLIRHARQHTPTNYAQPQCRAYLIHFIRRICNSQNWVPKNLFNIGNRSCISYGNWRL